MTKVNVYANLYCCIVPHSKQAKENVMHYKRAVEQGTSETHEQIRAKEEAINTAEFTRGEYATLCRGNTSQVPVFSLLALMRQQVNLTHQLSMPAAVRLGKTTKFDYSFNVFVFNVPIVKTGLSFLRSHSGGRIILKKLRYKEDSTFDIGLSIWNRLMERTRV